MRKFRTSLAQREAKAVREMNAVWKSVDEALQDKLAALEQRMLEALERNEVLSPAWAYQEARYTSLLAQVDRAIKDIASPAAEVAERFQADLVNLAPEQARQLVEISAGLKPAEAIMPWTSLPRSSVEQFVGFASDGSPLLNVFRSIAPDAVEALKIAVATGLGLGEHPSLIANRIRGVGSTTKNRAMTIARTEALRAHREASRAAYNANPEVVTGWIWHAKLDSETCGGCWAMHGTKHSNTERLDDHPNGRCAMVPISKSWSQILGDDTIQDTRPEVEPGESIFSTLGIAEQDRIVGPTIAQAYRDGRIPVSAFVHQTHSDRWGTMRRQSTVAEALGAVGEA